VRVYEVWIFIEILFLYFFLVVLIWESKDVGLIIYFFFQRVISLLLFVRINFYFLKIIIILLMAKLGLFPFFYWFVVVRIKVGLVGNLFVLGLQKISVFWLIWLILSGILRFVYFIIYLRVFFVVISLLLVVDLWLVLVYSSIANTAIIVLRRYGSQYFFSMFLYLGVIIGIVFFLKERRSYMEGLIILFFFLVIPPFILFWMKFYILLRIDFVLKIGFFFVIFDVLILLYYFSLVFIKFILVDAGLLVYFINLLVLRLIVLLRNYVTLIVFYKS
jgi:hypothetical protein